MNREEKNNERKKNKLCKKMVENVKKYSMCINGVACTNTHYQSPNRKYRNEISTL